MNRECKAELLGEEDRELVAFSGRLSLAELEVLRAARRYARVVAAVAAVSGRPWLELGAQRVGEILSARDELCAAAGEVEE
jgi:hypothetical protein